MRTFDVLVCSVMLLALASGCGTTPPPPASTTGTSSSQSNSSANTSQAPVIQFSQGSTGSYTWSDDLGSITLNRPDEKTIELKLTGTRGDHEISLAAIDKQVPDKPYRIYAISKLSPEQPIDAEHLMWFFRLIGADVAIQTNDETLITHPDLAIIEEFHGKLDQQPNIGEVVAAFPKLIRTDSRANLLIYAAKLKKLDEAAVNELIEIAASVKKSPLFVADREGISPSFDANSLSSVIIALAERGDLGPQNADRLAAGCEQLNNDYLASNALIALSNKASLDAVLKSAASIQDGQLQHNVLLELARRDPLPIEDADKIVTATPRLNYDYFEQAVLAQLANKASVPALLKSAGEISDGQMQHGALLEIIRRPDMNAATADAIAKVSPRINYDYFEAEILKALVGKASSAAILDGAAQISDGQMHHDVMMAIIQMGKLSGKDADHLAGLCPTINYDYFEDQVLTALAPVASAKAIINAASQISDGVQHYNSLAAIARKPNLTRQEANLVAQASPSIGNDYYETALLKDLASVASVDAMLTGVKSIDDGNDLHDVLMAVANREKLSPEDCTSIASATARVSFADHQQEILERLAGRASVEVIVGIVKNMSDDTAKYNVLMTIAKLDPLAAEDAERIAGAVGSISFSNYQADLLLALVGHAKPETLKTAAKSITTDSDRLRVLDALNR